MSQRYGAQMEETPTAEWHQFEGQIVEGRFLLRQYLGGSGHGAVFLTDDGPEGPQRAAIKLIPENPENAKLQLSRWELTSTLSHPHLIRLFHTGRCQLGGTQLLYVVMEYADEDLSQILPQRSLTSAEAWEMLQPALDALAYIHAKGFVHGHIKPANIMASGDQLKLSSDALCEMDEPIAGLGDHDPPESAASPAGDIWSLGVTLVEVLTQHLPVSGNAQDPDPQVPRTLQDPFFEIVRGCLRSDPSRRWKVSDVASHLQPRAAVQSEPKPPIPQKQVAATRRWTVPVLAIALLLAAILTVPRLLQHRPDAPRVAPQPIEKPASPVVPDQNQASSIQQPPALKNDAQEEAPATTDVTPAAPADATTNATNGDRSDTAADTAASSSAARSADQTSAPATHAVPSEGIHQVLPEVPGQARATIRGTIRVSVKVTVNASGNVEAASLDSPGPSEYFAKLALQAAQQWKFEPGNIDGRDTAGDWILRFEFTNTETKASPVRKLP